MLRLLGTSAFSLANLLSLPDTSVTSLASLLCVLDIGWSLESFTFPEIKNVIIDDNYSLTNPALKCPAGKLWLNKLSFERLRLNEARVTQPTMRFNVTVHRLCERDHLTTGHPNLFSQ